MSGSFPVDCCSLACRSTSTSCGCFFRRQKVRDGSIQPVEHCLVSAPQAARVGVLTGPLGFGQRHQGGGGARERLLDQLRLALEVLIVLRIHDQRGSHDLVRDAVKRPLPKEAPKPGSFRKSEAAAQPAPEAASAAQAEQKS